MKGGQATDREVSMKGLVFACTAFAVAACGGATSSSPSLGGMCPQVAPCGGSVLGTWNVVSECISSNAGMSSFGGCTMTFSDGIESVSGTVTFNADGTYTSDVSSTTTQTTTQSSGCFPSFGDSGTSPACPSPVNTNQPQETCQPWQGGCRCTRTSTTATSMGSGTYATSGTTFTTTSKGSTQPSVATYCVSGAALTIDVGGADGGAIGAVLVLHR
jgi:hypothetical protein